MEIKLLNTCALLRKRIQMIMRVFLLLMCTTVFSLSTNNSFSQEKIILKKDMLINVEEVFKLIKEQTDFDFIYPLSVVKNKPKVHLKKGETTLLKVLQQCLSNDHFQFELTKNNTIWIKEALNIGLNDVQQLQISGRVTDINGSPLPGANIIEKETLNGVQSDFDGNYVIDVANKNSILIVSYLGYLTQEITVGDISVHDIVLKEDASKLEEVVLIGYGTQRKENLTGSVASVDYSEITNRPSTNVVNSLAGSAPGVFIIQGSGQPGNDQASINIRGLGSINASSLPLIIIDGVTATVSEFGALSPNDIDKISVLKDAASSAIYGSRAANGVILVSTKTGIEKGIQVNLNTYSGFQEATVQPDLMNSWDYATLANEARINAGRPIFFSDEQIDLMRNNDPSDGFDNTNWADEVFRLASMQNYNLSLKAGTEKIKVFTSLNYLDQDGILLNTESSRFNIRNKVDYTINENIKLGLNISGMRQEINQPGAALRGNDGSILRNVVRAAPAAPIFYNNGNYFSFFNDVPGYKVIVNPLNQANLGDTSTINKDFTSTLLSEINWKGFKFNSLFSYTNRISNRRAWMPKWNIIDDTGAEVLGNTFATLNQSASNTDLYQIENYLNYLLELPNEHSFSFLVGHTFLDNSYEIFSAYGDNFPSNSVQVLNASNSETQQSGGFQTRHTLQSFFGRMNYDFKGKYLIEGNIRYDGSSRFSEGNKYGVFPSFSAGWVISKERFMESTSVINTLKLRASWGELGNQEIGNNYAFSSVFSTNTGFLVNGQLVNGAAITDLSNDQISWERTTSLNLGVDVSLFNKLSLTFDYFDRDVNNMLVRLPIPITLGDLGSPFQNIGEIENKGWELSGNYRETIKDFRFDLNFNITQVKNEVIDINEQEFFPTGQIITEGESLYSWFGYLTDGIFQDQESIDASPTQTPNAAPGDIKYIDISGVDGEPDGKIDSFDRTVIGNSFPEFSYGFGANVGFKRFNLNLQFQGVSKVDINTFQGGNHTGNATEFNWTKNWINRWTPDNPSTEYPRLVEGQNHNERLSDYWIKDGSYLKLRNIELGYNLPTGTLDKIGIKSGRIYVGGQNLLTFTKIKNFDPERARNEQRNEFYPLTKVYQLGLNLTF